MPPPASIDWTTLPGRILHIISTSDVHASTLKLVCHEWKAALCANTHPSLAVADLNDGDALGPLPEWCKDSLMAVQLLLGSPAAHPSSPGPCIGSPASHHEPPDHFGPGDARDLACALAKLGLANMHVQRSPAIVSTAITSHVSEPTYSHGTSTMAAVPARTLCLVMRGFIVHESVIASVLQNCPGLLVAWPKVQIVVEAAAAAPPVVQQQQPFHSLLSISGHQHAGLPNSLLIMDGTLSKHLTHCQLSTGLETSQNLATPLQASVCYSQLTNLALKCDVGDESVTMPTRSATQTPAGLHLPSWNRLLSHVALPVLASLSLHTGHRSVSLSVESLGSLTTLTSLFVTGLGLSVTPSKRDAGTSQTSTTVTAFGTADDNVSNSISSLKQLQMLRYDGFWEDDVEQHTPQFTVGVLLQPISSLTSLAGSLTHLSLGLTWHDARKVNHNCGLGNLKRLQQLVLSVIDDAMSTTAITPHQRATECTSMAAASSCTVPGSSQSTQSETADVMPADAAQLDLQSLLAGLGNLQSLSIRCIGTAMKSAPLLPTSVCSSIQHLILRGCSCVASAAKVDVFPEVEVSEETAAPHTSGAEAPPHLTLPAPAPTLSAETVTQHFLQPMATACPYLRTLELQNITIVTQSGTAGLQQACWYPDWDGKPTVRTPADLRKAFSPAAPQKSFRDQPKQRSKQWASLRSQEHSKLDITLHIDGQQGFEKQCWAVTGTGQDLTAMKK